MKIGVLKPVFQAINEVSPVFSALFVRCYIVRNVRCDVVNFGNTNKCTIVALCTFVLPEF
jgi:hypothetical protein